MREQHSRRGGLSSISRAAVDALRGEPLRPTTITLVFGSSTRGQVLDPMPGTRWREVRS